MSKKYLVTSGCSWTDHYFVSPFHRDLDTSWDKWPTILARKLDMEVINLGCSGSGNEGIYSRVSDFISETPKEKIGLVVVAWSRAHRRDWQLVNRYEPSHYNLRILNGPNTKFKKYVMNWCSETFDTKGDAYYFMKRSVRNFYALQILCERYNIPYKQVCALNPISELVKENIIDSMNYFSTSSQFEEIDKDNFIGWPIFEYMGGFILNDLIKKGNESLIISEEDRHPNALGQRVIADFIYENL